MAGVLAEAFLTDPYTVSFLPRSRRQERLTDMFDRVVPDKSHFADLRAMPLFESYLR